MNAEEFLRKKLSEFETMEMSNDKSIAVYMATVKAMEEFADLKCKEQSEIIATLEVPDSYGFGSEFRFKLDDRNAILNTKRPKL